ncbi:hypothetical protein QQS21_011050 [Conoideocrella luteorostrata]|uniref:L-ornithine N(5)-oxygenase n=1 Tax=Conoideocrella luteorostrata TaxID=1105319 RepID=A0AAJ0FTN5_9HYPO|nr:hypothetical protein QQS21_011050 [Conoideocrella luteorostrata]
MDAREELDLIIIGAGFSGICALIKTLQKLPDAKVAVFEKADSVGGTWAKNTYPGLSCDIPSQLYSYSFALNPDWQNVYASQPEILAYIKDIVSSLGISERIQLGQECTAVEWVHDESLWRVKLTDRANGRNYLRYARFLMTGVGFCDIPNGTENIRNVEKFKGRIFHSANWDHSFDFDNKDVIVVGNGCSANQFVPHLVNETSVRKVTQVVRSSHWIAPKNDCVISKWHKRLCRNFPAFAQLSRLWIAAKLDLSFNAFKAGIIGDMLRTVIQMRLTSYMRRLSPPGYHDMLLPDYDFGAKRPVMDHGYLSALHDSRLTLIRSCSLTILSPREVECDNGQLLEADAIIMANGFKTQGFLAPIRVTGEEGQELHQVWNQNGNFPSAYMGVCAAGFPNLFFLTGPNTLPSGHSTLVGVECSVEYILRIMSPFLKNSGVFKGRSIQVSAMAQERFNNWIQAKLCGLVYTARVENWYTDKGSGRNTLIWPGSQLAFWWSRCVRKPRWKDFETKF